MENDCTTCALDEICFYEYKPCACIRHRKFTRAEIRAARDPNFCQCIKDRKPLNNCKECPR